MSTNYKQMIEQSLNSKDSDEYLKLVKVGIAPYDTHLTLMERQRLIEEQLLNYQGSDQQVLDRVTQVKFGKSVDNMITEGKSLEELKLNPTVTLTLLNYREHVMRCKSYVPPLSSKLDVVEAYKFLRNKLSYFSEDLSISESGKYILNVLEQYLTKPPLRIGNPQENAFYLQATSLRLGYNNYRLLSHEIDDLEQLAYFRYAKDEDNYLRYLIDTNLRLNHLICQYPIEHPLNTQYILNKILKGKNRELLAERIHVMDTYKAYNKLNT